jgi:hypothetical protein
MRVTGACKSALKSARGLGPAALPARRHGAHGTCPRVFVRDARERWVLGAQLVALGVARGPPSHARSHVPREKAREGGSETTARVDVSLGRWAVTSIAQEGPLHNSTASSLANVSLLLVLVRCRCGCRPRAE